MAAEIPIDAPPERVWGMVSDIFLMPRLSSELQEVAWLDEARPARPSAAGSPAATPTSASGTWETVSTVTECDPPRRFAWAVGDPGHPIGDLAVHPAARRGGHAARAVGRMGPARSGLSIAIDAMPDKEAKIVFVRLREHETAMKHNLDVIKDRAERAG